MTATSSKAIPFVVLAIVGGLMAIDLFTPFKISNDMANLAITVLTPMGIGGIANKAWKIYQSSKNAS